MALVNLKEIDGLHLNMCSALANAKWPFVAPSFGASVRLGTSLAWPEERPDWVALAPHS